MKRFWAIVGWEFSTHLKSRRFILMTLLGPLAVLGLILLPYYYINHQTNTQARIGCVEFDSTLYFPQISEQLAAIDEGRASILLIPISADTTAELRQEITALQQMKNEVDSLEEALNKIKERRQYLFQRPASQTRRRLLEQSYEQLRTTRETKDLAQINYERMKTHLDSLLRAAVIMKADSMLLREEIEGYLLIEHEDFAQGRVELHSLRPRSFLQIEPLERALQAILVKQRMQQEGITVVKIQELLKPIEIREFLLEGATRHQYSFPAAYLAPVIVMLIMMVGIYTVCGSLFSTVVAEKSQRVLEMILGAISPSRLILSKVVGLTLSGLVQAAIWILITLFLILGDILSPAQLAFLRWENVGLFALYLTLGYFFFGPIFLGVGAIAVPGDNAGHLRQYLRFILFLPVMLGLFVLHAPDSVLVRVLSFVPYLTPVYMILRTPLEHPPVVDYYLSSGLMVVAIALLFMVAARLVQIGGLQGATRLSAGDLLMAVRTS